jgi:tRNA threonylcarbamoyladenosine biosynthesis protein TsaB
VDVIVLAIDTCDSRGSVAVLEDRTVLSVVVHDSHEDFSTWLLPAVSAALQKSSMSMRELEGFAAAAGPGSFTGVRVGLTTVKAWGEVYGRPITAVSRLRALAGEVVEQSPCVAAFADGHRGQVFGAVYRRDGQAFLRLGEEMVIAPGKFIETAVELAEGGGISWVSMDPESVLSEVGWNERELRGEKIDRVSTVLAPMIGRIGWVELAAGRGTDPLALDANYVRRTDAEVFWNRNTAHGS